jgi:hypothetical protein
MKPREALTAAGFTILEQTVMGRWFKVLDPTGEFGVVLRQHHNSWHFFGRDRPSVGHSDNPAFCHLGTLDQAIRSDEQLATYKQLMTADWIPISVLGYAGYRRALYDLKRRVAGDGHSLHV